jgi:putative MATE family efflux protein
MFDLSPEEIISDPVHRVLTLLAVPLVVQYLVQVAQGVADIFWLGQLGGDGVAVVGLVYPTVSLLLVAAISVPFIGTQVIVSQRTGADDAFGARKAAFNGLVLSAILALVGGGAAYVVAPTLIELMTSTRPRSAAEGILEPAINYFRIVSLGILFAATSDALEAALVGRGDSRAALHIGVVTVLTNLVADPLLIFGVGPLPAFGIEGAAVASALGYFTGLLLAVGYVVRGRSGGVLSRESMQIDLAEYRELFEVGLPPTAQRVNRRVVDIITVVVVFAAGGAAGLTAYIIGTRVFSVASVSAFGFQSATQSVVGQNLGADEPERADRSTRCGVLLIGGGLALLAVGQWYAAGAITNLMAAKIDAAAFELSVEFLRILAVSYPAVGVTYVLQGGFNGARRSTVSFYSSVFQYWVVQLPFAVAGGIVLAESVVAVFWAVAVAGVMTAVGLGLYYLHVSRSGMFENAAAEIERGSASD